jgi:hypothetical protein
MQLCDARDVSTARTMLFLHNLLMRWLNEGSCSSLQQFPANGADLEYIHMNRFVSPTVTALSTPSHINPTLYHASNTPIKLSQ